MQSFAQHKWCHSSTLWLVRMMHQLTENFLQLGRLQTEWSTSTSDEVQAEEKDRLRKDIRNTVLITHKLQSCHELGALGPDGWIYEAVRLTSLLYCHAIWARVPLYQAAKQACTVHDHTSDSSQVVERQNGCRVTPEMIHAALQNTPMKEVWDRMAGVLYWVLMVSASACHTPVTSTISEGGSPTVEEHSGTVVPRDLLRRRANEMAPRSGSAPATAFPGGFAPPEAPATTMAPHDTWLAQPNTTQAFSDFTFTMDPPSASATTDFAQQSFTSAPMNASASVPVQAHPFGTPGRIFQEYLESTGGVRGSSPSTIDSGRGAGIWTAGHSGPASGTHTPSPPSSVPSSIGVGAFSAINAQPNTSFSYSSNQPYTTAPTSNPGTTTGIMYAPQPQQQQQQATFPSATSPPSQGDNGAAPWESWSGTLFADTTSGAQQSQSFQATPTQSRRTQPQTSTDSHGERGKRMRRAFTAPEHVGQEETAKEQRAFVKRYLTANAVRVSILLRFEHTAAIVGGVVKLGNMEKYLSGS